VGVYPIEVVLMQRRKNLARPTEGVTESGSGVPGGAGGSNGHVTGTPEGSSGNSDLDDDLTIVSADDPNLGLTNIDDVPPEDWAADTGPTHTAEEIDRIEED
jgi:hypothetical protein